MPERTITDKDLKAISENVIQAELMLKLARENLEGVDDLRVQLAHDTLDSIARILNDIKTVLQKHK